MERAIWKGHITFGLVNISVALFPAEKRCNLHFHMMDTRNKARVRYERVNDETGEEVPWDKIVKVFEYKEGNYVVLKQEELKSISSINKENIDIISFVEQNSIRYMFFEKPYYIVPQKNAEKGYQLLLETLKHSKKIGIAKIIIRNKQHLAALIPDEDGLILDILRYNHEIKPFKEVLPSEKTSYKISDKELHMAQQLIEMMTIKWDPEQYKDDYEEEVRHLINQKIKSPGQIVKKPLKEHVETTDNTIDFVSIIKQSMENKKTETRKTPMRRKRKTS